MATKSTKKAPMVESSGPADFVVEVKDMGTTYAKKVYSGNVMYINPETRNGSAYVTLMVRFVDNSQVEDTPVGVFIDPGQLGSLKVGDLAAFAATKIIVGKTSLPDGTPIFNAAGFDKEFGVQIVREKAEEVELVMVGTVQSEGLRNRISELGSGLKGFLGLA